MSAPSYPPVTDSPWFWVLVFAVMALAALLAIGPKYAGRQSNIERQYQARDRVANDLAAPANRPDSQTERREYASRDNRLIPLWPLAAILSLLVLLSALMLFRVRRISNSSIAAGP